MSLKLCFGTVIYTEDTENSICTWILLNQPGQSDDLLEQLNEPVLNVFLLISELLMYDIWSCFFNCRLDSIKQPSVFSTLLVVTLPQHYAQALCIIRYHYLCWFPPHHLPHSRYFCKTLANAFTKIGLQQKVTNFTTHIFSIPTILWLMPTLFCFYSSFPCIASYCIKQVTY